MPDPAPIRGRWTIAPLAGYPRAFAGHVAPFLPTEPVEVVPVPDEAAIERGVDALMADSGLPRFTPVRAAVERRFRLGLRAALEPPSGPERTMDRP